jgi:hypothetical protein
MGSVRSTSVHIPVALAIRVPPSTTLPLFTLSNTVVGDTSSRSMHDVVEVMGQHVDVNRVCVGRSGLVASPPPVFATVRLDCAEDPRYGEVAGLT